MQSELVLDKKYKTALVINYVQATQLFLIRCIHGIVKHDKDSIDCIIVSINDVLGFNEDETEFFEQMKLSVNKSGIDFHYFNNGGKFESSQQAYIFGKLKESGTNDIVYLHEDCFIEKDNCIDELVSGTKRNAKVFGGIVFQTNEYYTARNELFYFNCEQISEYFDVSKGKTWSGQTLPDGDKVDAGTGLLSYYFFHNRHLMHSFDFSDYIKHPGDLLKSYHINSEYYNVANDFFNFRESIAWFINNQNTPKFLDQLFAKQYSYIVSMVQEGVVIESFDNNWMVSDNVKRMPTLQYMLRKK